MCRKVVRDEATFVFCERVDDVIREALGIELNVKPLSTGFAGL